MGPALRNFRGWAIGSRPVGARVPLRLLREQERGGRNDDYIFNAGSHRSTITMIYADYATLAPPAVGAFARSPRRRETSSSGLAGRRRKGQFSDDVGPGLWDGSDADYAAKEGGPFLHPAESGPS